MVMVTSNCTYLEHGFSHIFVAMRIGVSHLDSIISLAYDEVYDSNFRAFPYEDLTVLTD